MFRIATPVCFILFLTTTATSYAQESTREDFLAYAKTQTGRWIGDVTWITDWPGFGKKGDKVTGYWEGKMAEDGNVVIGRFFGGNGSGTTIAYFDAGSRKIIEQTVTSGGSVWSATITRNGDKFTSIVAGSNPNGDRIEAVHTLTMLDDGDKGIWAGKGKVGDEPTTLHDTWRRVGKASAGH